MAYPSAIPKTIPPITGTAKNAARVQSSDDEAGGEQGMHRRRNTLRYTKGGNRAVRKAVLGPNAVSATQMVSIEATGRTPLTLWGAGCHGRVTRSCLKRTRSPPAC